MQTINLADNINAAFDKVNENFGSLDSAVGNININIDSADITDIVNNILTEDYFLSVINEEYLQQFTINTSVDLTDVESGLSANASAIFTLESRIDQTDSGITVLSQAQIATQAQLDGLVLGGIDEDLLASAIASANSTIISRIDANSDQIVSFAGIIDSVENNLLLRDSATNDRIDLQTTATNSLTSRIVANENGLSAVVGDVSNLSLTLDQIVTDGISLTPEQIQSALASAGDSLTLRMDADSDKLVIEAAKVVTLETGLTALDSDLGTQITAVSNAQASLVSRTEFDSAEGRITTLAEDVVTLNNQVDITNPDGSLSQAIADAETKLSGQITTVDGRITSVETSLTNTLNAKIDSDIAAATEYLEAYVDSAGNTTSTWGISLVAGTEDDPKVAGIKFGNNGTTSDFSITTDAFKIFNGTTDVPAFKVENGDVFLDQVSINTLTVGDLQGDINVITPFSGSGYRTWGPTSAGYKLLTTVDLPANETPGIAHVPTINMAFSGIFKTDTAYIKLSMSKASTGLENYTQIQVMRQRSTSGGSSWAVIPVVGAWSSAVSEDVRFKVEVQMYGDNGASNTSASLGGTNYWSGTVAGLVGNVSNSLTTGGSTTTTAEDAGVSGTVVDTDGNTVTLTEDQLNNYDYSNVPNINIDLSGLF